jgi:hypothetical protein
MQSDESCVNPFIVMGEHKLWRATGTFDGGAYNPADRFVA